MKHIKLFENFKEDRVYYKVMNFGEIYRIFAQTSNMRENGEPYKDCEELFGKGSAWIDYPTYADARRVVDELDFIDSEAIIRPHRPMPFE